MIRLILFDIDGTLIRTGGAGQRAFDRAAENGFKIANGTAHLNFAGRTDSSIVRDFFSEHQIEPSQENFERFFDNYVFWLDELLKQTQGCVLPGVSELIQELKASAQPPVLGLLTGNIQLGAEIKLRHYDLWHHFELGAFGNDHMDRNQLAVIARERGSHHLKADLHGDEILVVGDTPRDIECGRAIEAKVLAVATGGSPFNELQRYQPDWLVKTLDNISASQLMFAVD